MSNLVNPLENAFDFFLDFYGTLPYVIKSFGLTIFGTMVIAVIYHLIFDK